jgi:hypothetical protein
MPGSRRVSVRNQLNRVRVVFSVPFGRLNHYFFLVTHRHPIQFLFQAWDDLTPALQEIDGLSIFCRRAIDYFSVFESQRVIHGDDEVICDSQCSLDHNQ